MTSSVMPVSIAEIRARMARVPRVPLALTPTPLEEAPRLAAELGIGRLFIKRDDLTGLAFGGNKTRNLEFRMAEAVALQSDVIIAGLEAQSNSARQTTAAANRLGMHTILILHAERDWQWQGNLLVDRLLGADVRFVQDNAAELDTVLRATAEEVRANGKRPYVMNHAGAFALGSALAYLLCTLEIVEQLETMGLQPSDLYMTSGNKGHAGLIAGQKLLGKQFRTVAISQRHGEDRIPGALSGAQQALTTLGFHAVELTSADVESYDEYVGTGYGAATDASLSAMQLAARTEGLLLDPVYTGKAMAGLIDQARRGIVGPQSTVVFIHTGGLPAMFAFKDEVIGWLDRASG